MRRRTPVGAGIALAVAVWRRPRPGRDAPSPSRFARAGLDDGARSATRSRGGTRTPRPIRPRPTDGSSTPAIAARPDQAVTFDTGRHQRLTPADPPGHDSARSWSRRRAAAAVGNGADTTGPAPPSTDSGAHGGEPRSPASSALLAVALACDRWSARSSSIALLRQQRPPLDPSARRGPRERRPRALPLTRKWWNSSEDHPQGSRSGGTGYRNGSARASLRDRAAVGPAACRDEHGEQRLRLSDRRAHVPFRVLDQQRRPHTLRVADRQDLAVVGRVAPTAWRQTPCCAQSPPPMSPVRNSIRHVAHANGKPSPRESTRRARRSSS